jgi:cytochrome o ubiquinol oxidase subunit IV
MSDQAASGAPADSRGARRHGDAAPGDQRQDDDEFDVASSIRSYLIGLCFAALLTAVSFYLSETKLIYGPGVAVALVVFAIAQMGVHLVFFLHLTTAPDNINNAMALAFGVLIVLLVIGGSLWIMSHLNHNMMPMDAMTSMQR